LAKTGTKPACEKPSSIPPTPANSAPTVKPFEFIQGKLHGKTDIFA
jgi:hypothetical protein